jgi:glutathione S-transferase
MDQAMNINDWYMFQGVGNVIGFQRVIAPAFLGLAPDEAIIEGAKPKARQVFAELSRLLGRQTFFAGEKVSLADLMLVPQIDFFSQMPEWSELVVPHANLVAWHERMTASRASSPQLGSGSRRWLNESSLMEALAQDGPPT